MVVQEVEVPPGQSIDLGERSIHLHRVELLASLEEGDFVAEVAHVWAAARDDDRVRHQVQMPLDQVAPDGRKRRERPLVRNVSEGWRSSPQVIEELRPGVLAGSYEDMVGMRRGFVGQRRDV